MINKKDTLTARPIPNNDVDIVHLSVKRDIFSDELTRRGFACNFKLLGIDFIPKGYKTWVICRKDSIILDLLFKDKDYSDKFGIHIEDNRFYTNFPADFFEILSH